MEVGKVPCATERYWRVQAGDTLYKIAVFSRTTVEEVMNLNPGIEPENLMIGQLICLPAEIACPSGVFWIVAPGDTFHSIAKSTGTTVEKLLELNPGINPLNLLVGQKVCLPG